MNGYSSENSSDDGAQLKAWFLSVLEKHREESRENLKMQLASLEGIVTQHISQLSDCVMLYSHYSHGDADFLPSELMLQVSASTSEDKRISSDTSNPDMELIHRKVEAAHCKYSTFEDLDDFDEAIIHEASMHEHKMAWEEYHRTIETSILGKMVSSTSFDIVIALCIVASAIVMFVEMEWYGEKARVSLGMQSSDTWSNAKTYFPVLEHAFNIIFLLELIARCAWFGTQIFRDGFAVMDLLLIISTSVHLYILVPLRVQTSYRPTIFRLIRLTRLVRVLRFMRVMKLCSELRVLLNTCVSCIQALVWSMIFLGVIMVSTGLFLTQVLQETILDSSFDTEIRLWTYRHYGSAFRSIYTMFEITFSGSWPVYFRPLIEEVNAAYIIIAFFYICIVVFALIRIISALFLKETLRVASADSQSMIIEQNKNKKKDIKRLAMVFKAMDVHSEGKLSVKEFQRVITHPIVRSLLQGLGMELHDPPMLVRLLADENGYVTYDDFVQGVIRLRGQAREIDVIAILHSEDKVRDMLVNVVEMMKEMMDMLPKLRAKGRTRSSNGLSQVSPSNGFKQSSSGLEEKNVSGI